jgi:hypothetical protein
MKVRGRRSVGGEVDDGVAQRPREFGELVNG